MLLDRSLPGTKIFDVPGVVLASVFFRSFGLLFLRSYLEGNGEWGIPLDRLPEFVVVQHVRVVP